MDSLPSSLLYYTSAISNFTRNCIRVDSLNQTTLSSNGVSQIRLALPVNSVLSLKSLSMHATVTAKQNTDQADPPNQARPLIPRGGIGALLDRVTWSAGGVSLDNGPVPYHVIQAVLDNLEKSNDKDRSDDRVLQQAEIEAYTVADKAANAQKRELIQNNFLGFTEAHPEYLDMSLLPECFMTVQCAPASVCPVMSPAADATLETPLAEGVSLGNISYSMDNIFFTVEVCQIGSGMYDALTQRLLQERGSIDVPYPAYQVFSSNSSAGIGEIRGSVSCMSLDRVYALARSNGDATSADPGWSKSQVAVKLQNTCGAAFQQKAVNFAAYNTDQWQFSLNNAPMPMYRATPLDAYNFAVCAEDRSYSKDRGSLVHSQTEWLANKWCATQRFCLDNDPTRLSGTNLSSINAQLIFSPSSGSTSTPAVPAGGVQMMLITKQRSVLRIGQSRACAVVA